MRTVELIPGVRSSVLGFGCAPILGSVDAATARRALGTALDEGVTHFDLARSYGYGEAEGFVGRFMRGRRDRIVFATKFGIVATPQARLLSPIKPLVRFLKKFKAKNASSHGAPALEMSAPAITIGERFHSRVPIEPTRLRVSIERSLRALHTDYIDYLFIHEPLERIVDMPAMLTAIQRLKSDGKIRGWGLAIMRDSWDTHMEYLKSFDVLQYNLSPATKDYVAWKDQRSSVSNVFFSPFRGYAPEVSRADVLKRLGADFPNSVVLCSMFNPEHIRANARQF